MSRLLDLPATPIEDGVTVVEASAGTGKTYCLVGLALRLPIRYNRSSGRTMKPGCGHGYVNDVSVGQPGAVRPGVADPPLLAFTTALLVAILTALTLISVIGASGLTGLGELTTALRRVSRWFHHRLLPIVAGFILLAAIITLISGLFGTLKGLEAIYILAIMLIAAAFARYGDDLLSRITKAGPFEFAERQIEFFGNQLESIQGGLSLLGPDLKLTEKNKYYYEKAARFVELLGFIGLEQAKVADSKRLRSLLETIVRIATKKHEDHLRATEWLETLIKLADGKKELADAHYRAGFAFHSWAEAAKEGDARTSFFEQQVPHHEKVINLAPDDYRAYFLLAWAYDELGQYGRAVKYNLEVLRILPLATAKYNISISRIKSKEFRAAFDAFDNIERSDQSVATVVETARTDPEFGPLRDDPAWSARVREVLEKLSAP